MFERRLKIILALPIIFGAVIVVRLYQLQILKGDDYERQAEAALVSPKQFLPPLRGRILDRSGRVLVSDEPAHDVTVHYGILSLNRAYLLLLADNIRRQDPNWRHAADAALEAEVQHRIADMWLTLERASGVPLKQLLRRREAICYRIERLRRHIWDARRKQGLHEDYEKLRLAQEDWFHSILRDVTPALRTRIELDLSGLPCVRVEPSVRRVWRDDAETLCHVLGRLGQVSAEQIKEDPLGDDWLACYRAGGLAGVSGVERLAEHMLRGKRGYEEHYRDGTPKEQASSIDGLDVQLTIDMDLQRRVAGILAVAVIDHPPATGASCVVIDVESREILALVSVPTYSRQTLRTRFEHLRDDAKHLPLLFRAVQGEYQPGSIIKPVSLLAGFSHNLVDSGRTVFCDGQLIPGAAKWHCWTHWRGMAGHGPVAAEEAIQHSCNVYFYTLGQRINAKRITAFFRSFIRGSDSPDTTPRGTGLIEERPGLIPSLEWMRQYRNRRFRPADGRNYAIGQGEIQLTPLQAANMFATIATGRYQDPTIIANDMNDRPVIPIDAVPASAWQLTRRGLYRCVNEQGGTAFKHARLDAVEICGKTGSAQCTPRVVRRRFTFAAADETGSAVSVIASTVEAACEALDLPVGTQPAKTEIVERYPVPDPDSGKIPTHAWFAGFAPYRNPKIALTVLVEYGGSGGRTAGPVGRQVFEALLESPRGYLEG